MGVRGAWLLGNNEGANPLEFLLHALAGCITTTFVLHATARGVRVRKMSTRLSGDIFLQALLAPMDDVFPGYEKIRVEMDIDADCSDRELEALLRIAEKHSRPTIEGRRAASDSPSPSGLAPKKHAGIERLPHAFQHAPDGHGALPFACVGPPAGRLRGGGSAPERIASSRSACGLLTTG